MAYACMSNTGILNAETLLPDEWEALKRRQKFLNLRMPCCGAAAGMRGADHMKKRAHFFHLGYVTECPSHAPETEEHRRAKAIICKAAKTAGWQAEEEYWGQATDTQCYRADVLAWKGDRKIAFEVQLSPQTDVESERRQQLFQAAGIENVWFFSGNLPPTGFCTKINVGQEKKRLTFQVTTREGLSFGLGGFIAAFLEGTWDEQFKNYCTVKRLIQDLSSTGDWEVSLTPWKDHLPTDPEYWRTSMVLSHPAATVLVEPDLPVNVAEILKESQQEAFTTADRFTILTHQGTLFKAFCYGEYGHKELTPYPLSAIISHHLLDAFQSNTWATLKKAQVSYQPRTSCFGEVDPFPKMAQVKLYAYTIPCVECQNLATLLETISLKWGPEDTHMRVRDFEDWFWDVFPPELLLPIVGYPDKSWMNKCVYCGTLQPPLKGHPNREAAEEAIIGNYQSISHTRWLRHSIWVNRVIQPGWVRPNRAIFHIEEPGSRY